ncbi:MAG: 3-oxoacyl-ACP reductase family protein [Polyangiales bacterium]
MNTLQNKVALVTGGSRGIGAAVVERLHQEGARVAFTYRGNTEAAQQLTARLDGVLAIVADSADEDALRRAVQQTVETFGGLDILVNNAAIAIPGMLTDTSTEDLDRQLSINVRGPILTTREALRHMRDGGRVINVGSVNGSFVPVPGMSLYSMTKGAITAFTHGLAHELGARGITVNDVQPGPVDTDMNPADGPFSEALTPRIAVKRYGRTHEVAALVAHLAGPEAGYITGAGLRIDGGFSA